MRSVSLSCVLSAALLIGGLAEASCGDVPTRLFGLSLGPRVEDGGTLAPGIIEEGWAEVVKDVGFDTLEGRIAGWDVVRIMAFFDRGNYVAFTAILGNGKGSAAQLVEAAGMVEEVLGSELKDSSSGALSGQCERGIALTLQGVDWEGDDRVKLEVKSADAVENMRAYVSEYCADSSRIRPEDSCKR